MAKKTTVAVRFTKEIAEIRRTGFVNDLSRLIVEKLKENRPGTVDKSFVQQWFRLPDEKLVYIVNVWGEHETKEVREVVHAVAIQCDEQALPVVLDIVMQ